MLKSNIMFYRVIPMGGYSHYTVKMGWVDGLNPPITGGAMERTMRNRINFVHFASKTSQFSVRLV